jgi:outer membrane protein TolC
MNSHGKGGAAVAALLMMGGITVPMPVMSQAMDQGAPVVSLAEARRRATSVDPNAVAARGQIATAAWERRAAMADVLTPRLTAGGSYTHSPDSVFNFGTFGLSRTATSATLQASYTLLGAGKFGALRSSRASVESAEASETAVRFRTALAADAAYFAVLADRELSRVAADRLRRAEEQFGIARVRVLAGEAIAPDSLQLLLEVNRARLAVLSRDSALVTSRLRLGRQIGLSGPADAEPVDTAVPPPLPMTQEQAISEMRARGPDLEAARAAERRADAIVLAERETYLPTITVGVQRAAYDRELFPEQTFRTEYAVTVSFPIWNAGQRELAVARARVDRDVARSERQDRERGAAEEIAQAYHGYLTSRAGIELAQIGVAASAENFRVQSARYREGATTILDLLEAQVALSEAEAALVQSRYSTRLALAQIEALLGRRISEASTTDRN